MPNATHVAVRLESLLQQRKVHADAIAVIDELLEKVAGVLTTDGPRGRVGRPPGSVSSVSSEPAKRGRKRRRRSRFAVSGNETILTFVGDHPNATTQDIKKHWAAQGRGGGADNALSLLTKAKKLKRTALGKGIRGSSYVVP